MAALSPLDKCVRSTSERSFSSSRQSIRKEWPEVPPGGAIDTACHRRGHLAAKRTEGGTRKKLLLQPLHGTDHHRRPMNSQSTGPAAIRPMDGEGTGSAQRLRRGGATDGPGRATKSRSAVRPIR